MNFKASLQEEVTGGYWAEVPAPPGWMTQGETKDELPFKLRVAIEGVVGGHRVGLSESRRFNQAAVVAREAWRHSRRVIVARCRVAAAG